MSEATPLIEAKNATIGNDDTVLLRDLSLQTSGRNVLVIDPEEALFGLLASVGKLRLASGSLSLVGRAIHETTRRRNFACLPAEQTLPQRWTVSQYHHWSGRLAGMSRRIITDRSQHLLEQLGLDAVQRHPLHTLDSAKTMAVRFSATLLPSPEVLAVQIPGERWGNTEAQGIQQWCAALCPDTRLLLCCPSLPKPTSLWFELTNELCMFRHGALIGQEAPARLLDQSSRFTLTVKRSSEAFQTALDEHGICLRGGPRHFTVTLSAEQTGLDVFRLATETDTAIVSWEPIFSSTVL